MTGNMWLNNLLEVKLKELISKIDAGVDNAQYISRTKRLEYLTNLMMLCEAENKLTTLINKRKLLDEHAKAPTFRS